MYFFLFRKLYSTLNFFLFNFLAINNFDDRTSTPWWHIKIVSGIHLLSRKMFVLIPITNSSPKSYINFRELFFVQGLQRGSLLIVRTSNKPPNDTWRASCQDNHLVPCALLSFSTEIMAQALMDLLLESVQPLNFDWFNLKKKYF